MVQAAWGNADAADVPPQDLLGDALILKLRALAMEVALL
jgi:hypothetical protein